MLHIPLPIRQVFHIFSRPIFRLVIFISLGLHCAIGAYGMTDDHLREKLLEWFPALYDAAIDADKFYSVKPEHKDFIQVSFEGEGRRTIRYTKVLFQNDSEVNPEGSKGVLIISPGRGEYGLECIETAYDYMLQGYSPAYILDHRGQGASEILKTKPEKNFCHLDDWRLAVSDFRTFTKKVREAEPGKKLHLVSFDVGALIAAHDIFTDHDSLEPEFNSVIMISPLLSSESAEAGHRDYYLEKFKRINWFLPNRTSSFLLDSLKYYTPSVYLKALSLFSGRLYTYPDHYNKNPLHSDNEAITDGLRYQFSSSLFPKKYPHLVKRITTPGWHEQIVKAVDTLNDILEDQQSVVENSNIKAVPPLHIFLPLHDNLKLKHPTEKLLKGICKLSECQEQNCTQHNVLYTTNSEIVQNQVCSENSELTTKLLGENNPLQTNEVLHNKLVKEFINFVDTFKEIPPRDNKEQDMPPKSDSSKLEEPRKINLQGAAINSTSHADEE